MRWPPSPCGLVLFAAGGCTVVDAPESLEDLMVYGFVEMGHPERLDATAVALDPLRAEFADQLAEGYRVGSLTPEAFAAVDVVVDDDTEVVGLAAAVEMGVSLDAFAWAWTLPDMADLLETTLEFEITAEDGDRDCFLSRTCDTYGYDGRRVNDLGFFGTSTQTFRRDYRWAALEDGTPVFVVRDMVPTPAEMTSAVVRIDQQYAMAMVFETPAGTERVEAFWVEATAIGVDLPDAFALNTAVNQMNRTAGEVEDYVADHYPG